MGSKWMMGLIAVIAVAAAGGIGFATYSSTASITVTANAGSFYVQATGELTASSLTVGSCSSSVGPAGSISVTANDMLPGDYCNWTFVITDPGSIGGNYISGQLASFSGPGCSQISSYGIWTTFPIPNLNPGSANYASFWQNESDVGSGLVSGACSATWNVVYDAA
jgi:hypothetical protein